jgi:hypothetical protein
MPDQQGYALLRSFPELDVAGVLPCSNLERLKGDWFCWMGHPKKTMINPIYGHFMMIHHWNFGTFSLILFQTKAH